jgi:hypothetical protein
MDSREEVIEAAMLARMVGSHLSGVDQLTVERSNNSANKINMQNFVAPLLGKQQNFNSFNTVGATPDMIRAYEGLNELALSQVPDITQRPNVVPQEQQLPIIQPPITITNAVKSNVVVSAPVEDKRIVNGVSGVSILTRSDVDSIRTSLKNIDKSLATMVKYFTNNKTETTITDKKNV